MVALMGRAIPARQFLLHRDRSYARPLFFCREIDGVTDEAQTIDVVLSRRLVDVPPAMRSIRLADCLNGVLDSLPDDVVIRDFDVLFNPAYKVDVVQLLADAYRRHRFDLVWPGGFDRKQTLTYAEEGYPDYRTYDIRRYDITCVY